MNNNPSLIKYIIHLENFYTAFAETAKSQGLLLNFFRAEASPCNNQGKPMSLPELKNIFGNDIPLTWKWSYKIFLEDSEHLQKNLEIITATKGYDIAFNFAASDACLGNVVLKIFDKWFTIGECINCTTPSLYKHQQECLQKSEPICIKKFWSPFYVLSRIEKMETQLNFSEPIKKRTTCCLDFFL
ncbi:MAG: hypothetical protein QM398_07185 [Thermoproteota archaeon]|jgi:hypothetical protein|nr:hypothetical protein [Thermoproteota archaeon]